jgi:hypothetical protein
MDKLPNAQAYNGFAYHVALLLDFSSHSAKDFMRSGSVRSDHGGRLSRQDRRSIRRLSTIEDHSNASLNSLASLTSNPTHPTHRRGGSLILGGGGGGGSKKRAKPLSASVTGGSVFKDIGRRKKI